MIIEDYVFGVFLPTLMAGIWIGVAVWFQQSGNYTGAVVSLVATIVFLAMTYIMGAKLIKFHDNLIEHYATTTYSERRGMR